MKRFTAPDGADLAYTDPGTGRPLLCLSGLTRNSSDFSYLAPHLPGIRMICLDYRGRGQSAWTGAASYTVPTEAQDALALMDHLGLDSVPILGTSRGGLIGMGLGAMAADRLTALCLNDIGPVIEKSGLDMIKDYVGRNPSAKTMDDAVAMMSTRMAGFEGVPESRWREEAEKHFLETPDGLTINYDPELRTNVVAPQPEIDLWPMFDALAGMPLALIRGVNSDLLSLATADEMARHRPDMVRAEVPGRGHVPFLDEPEALAALRAWLDSFE
ncbi:MAG: alpha/beta hydrolase [Pseudomonadota bacterium]